MTADVSTWRQTTPDSSSPASEGSRAPLQVSRSADLLDRLDGPMPDVLGWLIGLRWARSGGALEALLEHVCPTRCEAANTARQGHRQDIAATLGAAVAAYVAERTRLRESANRAFSHELRGSLNVLSLLAGKWTSAPARADAEKDGERLQRTVLRVKAAVDAWRAEAESTASPEAQLRCVQADIGELCRLRLDEQRRRRPGVVLEMDATGDSRCRIDVYRIEEAVDLLLWCGLRSGANRVRFAVVDTEIKMSAEADSATDGVRSHALESGLRHGAEDDAACREAVRALLEQTASALGGEVSDDGHRWVLRLADRG